MSRMGLVDQLVVFLVVLLVFSLRVRCIGGDQNVTNLSVINLSVTNRTVANLTDHHQTGSEERPVISKRSSNVILDGIQYLPECGLLCKLHRFTSHLPPVMINFNHQYQHYVPIEPIPIPLHHEEIHQPDLHMDRLHHELDHELHHPELHHHELHHANLHSDLHLGLHPKLLPDLHAHHQFGLPMHEMHPHLGLSSSFHQKSALPPPIAGLIPNPTMPGQPLNHLQTSASTVTHRNNEDNLDAIQKIFSSYESKYPVSIVEEHFALPRNYMGTIETHQSSVRPLFIPEKSELKASNMPPYQVEDSRSTIIDYQPFPPPRFPPDHHFEHPPPHYHHPPPPPAAFLHPPHHASIYPPNAYYDKENIPIYPKSKPNIEILKLNEQDYPLPAHKPTSVNSSYENLIAELHARIKDPTTYYQHPEPEKGSIVYADSDLERRRPPTSKIDENSVLNIGQNYGRVKIIQEQLNSMKRQFPEEELPPIDYHHRIHHHEMTNSHFGNMPPIQHHRPHIETHHYNPPHLVEHYQPPIVIEDAPPPPPPMHIGHHQSFSLPGPQPKSFKKPTMEFNGFYSNFYAQLPPAPPPHHYSSYKK